MDKIYNQLPQDGFLRLSQVLQFIPVSRSTWLHGCQTGRFPQPVKIGPRLTAWRAADIHALVKAIEETQGIPGGQR